MDSSPANEINEGEGTAGTVFTSFFFPYRGNCAQFGQGHFVGMGVPESLVGGKGFGPCNWRSGKALMEVGP